MTAGEPQFPLHFGPFTPADYLVIVVLPTLAEFMDVPDNRRRMYLACIATAHMVDHIARTVSPTAPENYAIRKEVRAQGSYATACLDVVEAICNGTKHAGPDPRRKQAFNYAPGQERFMPPLGSSAPGGGMAARIHRRPRRRPAVHRRLLERRHPRIRSGLSRPVQRHRPDGSGPKSRSVLIGHNCQLPFHQFRNGTRSATRAHHGRFLSAAISARAASSLASSTVSRALPSAAAVNVAAANCLAISAKSAVIRSARSRSACRSSRSRSRSWRAPSRSMRRSAILRSSSAMGYKVGFRAFRRAGRGWITSRLTRGTASRNADRIERHQHQGFTLVRDALAPVVPARPMSKTVDCHPEQGCCVRVCKPPVRRHGATLECGAGIRVDSRAHR